MVIQTISWCYLPSSSSPSLRYATVQLVNVSCHHATLQLVNVLCHFVMLQLVNTSYHFVMLQLANVFCHFVTLQLVNILPNSQPLPDKVQSGGFLHDGVQLDDILHDWVQLYDISWPGHLQCYRTTSRTIGRHLVYSLHVFMCHLYMCPHMLSLLSYVTLCYEPVR